MAVDPTKPGKRQMHKGMAKTNTLIAQLNATKDSHTRDPDIRISIRVT
jgi:hypothetical protein